MANEQNLKPVRTKKEAREKGKAGGIASGKAKREKKLIKEQFDLLLSLPLKDEKAKSKIKSLGVNTNNIDNQMAMVISMWNKALKGDVQAFNSIRDTLGQKPIEQIEISKSTDETIKEVEEYLNKKDDDVDER